MNDLIAAFIPTTTDLLIVVGVLLIGAVVVGLRILAAPLERVVPSWVAALAAVALFVVLGFIAGRL